MRKFFSLGALLLVFLISFCSTAFAHGDEAPFGASVYLGGLERNALAFQRRGADKFAFLFVNGGEALFSEKRMAWGTRYTLERLSAPGARSIRFSIVRAPWATESSSFANLLTDGKCAVSVRSYDVAAAMRSDEGVLWLEADVDELSSKVRFAVVDGPVEGFRERLQAMTRDFCEVTKVPLPVNGGAFSQTSDATRASYFMVTPNSELIDEAIDMAVRTGASILHFKNWWQTIGHYRANTNLFKGGEAAFKASIAKARAAGLDVSMHSLCASVGIDDEWVSNGDISQFKSFPGANYTLAEPIDEKATSLKVNERIRDGHHRTLTYLGNGNVLRIGAELIQYSDFNKEERTFTGLTRGAFGTRALAHPAKAPTDYVQHHFMEFFPKRTSPLVQQIENALISRYTQGGFVQFYFDGIEGLCERIFEDESCRAIYTGLAKARPPIVEASSYRPHSWWWHSRTGTWDTPVWNLKRFHDLHLKALDESRRIDYLAVGTGWFYPKSSDWRSRGFRRDEIEYFAAKNAGRDYPFSTGIGGKFPGRKVDTAYIDSFTIIGWYERLRKARAFAEGVREKINSGLSEWRLRQDLDGEWTVRPVQFISAAPSAVTALRGNEDLAIRVESAWGVDEASARVLVDNIGKVSHDKAFFRSWEFPHASVLPKGVDPESVEGRPVWRLRVKGDGKGGLLRLRVATPREFGGASAEHVVPIDFDGWRNVLLFDRARDAASDDPLKRYLIFRNPIAPNRISEISLTLDGGASRAVEVSSLEALTPVASERSSLAVVVNGARIDVPFTLQGDEIAELENGLWRKYDGSGLTVGEAVGPRLKAKAGKNEISVKGECRALVQALGLPESAVADNLDDAQRKVLSTEYDFTRVWDPSKGVTRLDPVVVRPGERARLKVCYVGDYKEANLKVNGIALKEGLNDALFEGVNELSFSCKSSEPVRIEIAKVYDTSLAPKKVAEKKKRAPKFTLGYQLDAGRGKVPKAENLRIMVDVLSKLGYSEFQLYNQSTFDYTNHPAMRPIGPKLNAAEIRALDDYCASKGVELVPNQNSFGHLGAWFTRPQYKHLAECPAGVKLEKPKLNCGPTALCATSPESIRFLSGLYDEFLPCFRSKRVNVGCDEVWDILDPRGKSAAKVKELGEGRVYLGFIKNVHALLAERGKTMMFWADMIFRHPELVPELPREGMIALDWGYEANSPFESHCAALERAGVPFYVCPGTSSWGSLFGRVANMKANIDAAVGAAKKHGGIGLLLADWGDGGHPQPWIVSVPSLVYAAARVRGEEMDDKALAEAIDRVCGAKCGAALIKYGNAYLKCGAQRPNGTYLYTMWRKRRSFVPPKGMTEETMASVFAEFAAARAELDLEGAPEWVKDDFALLDLLSRYIELRWRGLHDQVGKLAEPYKKLWMRQNKKGAINDLVREAFDPGASAAPKLLTPADGAVVPLLKPSQKEFLNLDRNARREFFTDPEKRKNLAAGGWQPASIRFSWKADSPSRLVVLRRDGVPFFVGNVSSNELTLSNFEIGQSYDWRVVSGGLITSASFSTAPDAPRLLDVDSVPNFRDLGGRRGIGARRVRQGMVFRSAAFNDDVSKGPDGKVQPGRTRINELNRDLLLKKFAIRTDIDLRRSDECFGMTMSPLGETVKRHHISSGAYEYMARANAREAFAKVFRLFLDEGNYPINFHCAGGQDRTGAVAFILNALLGVDEEELIKDWESSAFWNPRVGFSHKERFDKLVAVFDVYKGNTINERVEAYVKSLGFIDADIKRFRDLMLED